MKILFNTIVINEPDDVTVCEGEYKTRLVCVLNTTNSNISSVDVSWYRFIKATEAVHGVRGGGMIDVPISNDTSLTTTLYIFNARKFFTGYYWVRLSSGDDVCNTSFTVTTSTYVCE